MPSDHTTLPGRLMNHHSCVQGRCVSHPTSELLDRQLSFFDPYRDSILLYCTDRNDALPPFDVRAHEVGDDADVLRFWDDGDAAGLLIIREHRHVLLLEQLRS